MMSLLFRGDTRCILGVIKSQLHRTKELSKSAIAAIAEDLAEAVVATPSSDLCEKSCDEEKKWEENGAGETEKTWATQNMKLVHSGDESRTTWVGDVVLE